MKGIKRLVILGVTALILGGTVQATAWDPINGPFPPRGPWTCGGLTDPCPLK